MTGRGRGAPSEVHPRYRPFRLASLVSLSTLATLAGLAAPVARASGAPEHEPRALALGGVGVADRASTRATHPNPAALAYGTGADVRVPAGYADTSLEGDLVTSIDEVASLLDGDTFDGYQQRFDEGTATAQDLSNLLDLFLFRLPAAASSSGSLGVRSGAVGAFRGRHWGVEVGTAAWGDARAVTDLVDGLAVIPALATQLFPDPPPGACSGEAFCLDVASRLADASGGALSAPQAEEIVRLAGPDRLREDADAVDALEEIVGLAIGSSVSALSDNDSAVTLTGILTRHVGFKYGYPVWGKRLALGGTLRVVEAEVYGLDLAVDALPDVSALFDRLDRATEPVRGTAPAIDIGLLARPSSFVSLGLTAENVNGPSWDAPGGERVVRFDPRVRVGVQWRPVERLRWEFDVDVVPFASPLDPDTTHRVIATGVELALGAAVLRAGARYDAERSVQSFSGGVGLRAGRAELDLGVAFRPETETLSSFGTGIELPRGVSVALGIGWAGRS